MEKDKILALPKLRVYEHQQVWSYSRGISTSGYPYYIAPPVKAKFHTHGNMDDYLFLPIDYETFKKDRENYFYGFRFLIAVPGFTSIATIPELHLLGQTQIEIAFEATRVRYFMDDDEDFDIAIDYMGDSMFPTRLITLTQDSRFVGKTFMQIIDQLIDDYCIWYADKRI